MIRTKKLTLKKNFLTSWQFSVATTSLILGFLLSIQFKSQAEHRAASIPSRRIEEVANLLKDSEEKRTQLEKTVSELRDELNKLKTNGSYTNNESTDKLVLTGFTPLIGQGVMVTVSDSKKVLQKGENPANGIVHNEDLLKITNELYSAGAEVISINGNRLIANTEISCAGPTILINKNRVAPPFEISAIGKPEALISSLEMRGGILETLKFFGLEVKIEKKEDIKIPAYSGSTNFKYSKPIKSDEG